MQLVTINDLDIKHKRLLIRSDLNLPFIDGKVADTSRLIATIPLLQHALKNQAQVLLISHLGQPKNPIYSREYSLQPLAELLEKHLDAPVKFVSNWIDGVNLTSKEITLGENVRFLPGEVDNDIYLSQSLAKLCDIYVMDAFASCHRSHASTCGITKYVKHAVAGPCLVKELTAINRAIDNHNPPVVAIVGGAKISSKIKLLESLISKVDILLLGGAMANTFLFAIGYNLGCSLFEPKFKDMANKIAKLAKDNNVRLILPIDFKVAKNISKAPRDITIDNMSQDEAIYDIGEQTVNLYSSIIYDAKTIIWNGPLGAYEHLAFQSGTLGVMEAIENSSSYKIAGGGDSMAIIQKYNKLSAFDFVSTGGGAFLAYLEDHNLPGIRGLNVKKN